MRDGRADDQLRRNADSEKMERLTMIKTAFAFAGAALFEIAGCFSFWLWLREGRSALFLMPGVASLILFAWMLTLVDTNAAGRAYATYGGIYICASLLWLWAVEGIRPDRWDLIGGAICLLGASVILFGPRATT